jgi:hypothetical protein
MMTPPNNILNDPRLGLPSASDAHLRYPCLGQRNLRIACEKKGLLLEDSTPEAQSGTRVHEARHTGDESELEGEEAHTAFTLASLERNIVDSLLGPEAVLLFREKRLYLRDGLTPIFSGQLDYAYGIPESKHVLIVDDKTGRIEVPPAFQNYQLRDLAALWHANFLDTKVLDVAIVQPWITHEPSVARYSGAELELAEADLRDNLKSVADPNAPRTPGSQCKFCPVSVYCAEGREYAQGDQVFLARYAHGEISIPTGERARDLLDWMDTAEEIFKKIKAAYKDVLAKDPEAVADYFLKEGSTVRSIKDIEAARMLIEPVIGTPGFEEAIKTEISVTSLEKSYCNVSGKIQKKAKNEFNALLSSVITEKQNSPSLKRRPMRGKHAKELTNG